MSTNTTPSTPSPEHSHDPEDDEPVLLPIYLVEDDEIPDLLHPECCIRKIPNTPPEDPGIECVIFRREDYSEKDNEDYTFGGLLLLERELFGPDDFADPSIYPTLWTKDIEDWSPPKEFRSPCCPEDTAEHFDGEWPSGWWDYLCNGCGRHISLERRPPIENAAAIRLSRYVPEVD